MLVVSTAHPAARLTRRSLRFFASQKKSRLAIKTFYQTLRLTEDCEDEMLRLAFVNLAKRFHPDSGTSEASSNRFCEIENAYRQIQRHRLGERDKGHPAAEEFDIKHTSPQHRHYLALFAADRAQKSVLNVIEQDVKTRFGIYRLVEDLIQESMSKGEFSDLPGMGKPLKQNTCRENPYVDFVTHKLNQVLLNNGFTPEWIKLSKEIRQDSESLKKLLEQERNKLGDAPLAYCDEEKWQRVLRTAMTKVTKINKNIDKYNLIVPILQKQMLQIDLDSLADAALAKPPPVDENASKRSAENKSLKHKNESDGFMQILTHIFSK